MLKKYLKNLDNKDIQEKVQELHGYDLASDFLKLDEIEKILILEYLKNEQLAELVTYLDYQISYKILSNFEIEKQVIILDLMEIDDEVDLLQVYQKKDENNFEKILEKLSDFKIINKLLKYKKNQTGAFISNEIITLNKDLDVKKASIEVIKKAPNAENISTIYVVDENNKYLGIVPLQKLVKARYPLTLKDILIEEKAVYDDEDIEVSANTLNLSARYEIAVINRFNVLEGVLALDDVFDIISDEAEKDINKLALLPSKESKNIFITSIKRVPWLLLLIVLGIPTVLMNKYLTESLRNIKDIEIILITVMLPLMLDSPGNVGTQTLAMSLIRLSRQGKITIKQAFQEFKSGFFTAILMSIITMLAAFIFIYTKYPNPILALKYVSILSISLLFALIISTIIGMLVPSLLKKLKLDPATASGPLITTICDFASTGIYLSLSIILLSTFGGK